MAVKASFYIYTTVENVSVRSYMLMPHEIVRWILPSFELFSVAHNF